MKGVVFLGNQKLEIREFPKPEPGLGEVLIEMKASGLCGSDLHMYRLPAAEFPELDMKAEKGTIVISEEAIASSPGLVERLIKRKDLPEWETRASREPIRRVMNCY